MQPTDFQRFSSRLIGGGNFQTLILHYLRNSLSFFLRGNLDNHRDFFLLIFTVTLYPMLTKMQDHWYGNPLRMCAAAYVIAYACTLIGTLIRNKYLRNTFYTTIFLFVLLHCVFQIFSLHVTGAPFDKDRLSAILATNAGEASEFINTYCTSKTITLLCGLPLLLAVVVWLGRHLRFQARKTVHCIGILVFLSIIGIAIPLKDTFYCHTVIQFTVDLSAVYDTFSIKLHHTRPDIKITSTDQPPILVWIIGESLTSHHCSLYGYTKPTNPLLQKRVDAGEAFVYTGVQAAELHTQETFELMMNTCTKSISGNTKWYDCPTLPDIAQAAGYRTIWLSNQSKKGLYDNIVSQYADLCDTCVFIGNKFDGAFRKSVDGELLPVFKSALAHPSAKDFYVVHLMGCHAEFKMRYPATFARFKEYEYADHPKHQREQLSTYDNAVLYNDYIVNTLMSLVADREAVVVYAPDHGLDVFESNPNVASHGNADNPISSKAGHDIPLIIYTTKAYRQRHPYTVARMKRSTSRTFDMEDAIYLMMDLMQCDFASKPAVSRRSLIRA